MEARTFTNADAGTLYLMHKGKELRFQIVRNDSPGIAPGASTSVECDLPPAPLITQMLVLAACNARDGPFAGFDLTEQEWYELKAACWLHDCGKVTTPGHIVDKATRLECIYAGVTGRRPAPRCRSLHRRSGRARLAH